MSKEKPTPEEDKEYPLGLLPDGKLNVVDPATLDDEEDDDEA